MSAAPGSTLEVIWQSDACAYALVRAPDGTVSPGGLRAGMATTVDIPLVGREIAARRLEVRDIVALAEAPPDGLALGGSAQATFAVVELARRSVTEGLVHPHLDDGEGSWFAFWGATLDEHVEAALSAVAAALPPVSAAPFHGDAETAVHDLYPDVVDHLARERLRADNVRLAPPRRGRATALDHFLEGLTAADALLPRHSGYAALERRLARWVDEGLANLSATRWKLGLHLDERERGDGEPALVLELWLHAEDDPTLNLPASLLWRGGNDVFGFVRAGEPRSDLARQLAAVEPLLAEAGATFDADEPTEAELDPDAVGAFLREAMPRLEERDVAVLLPASWLRSTSRVRVNLTVTAPARSSGLLSRDALAQFDWRLAVGDTSLTEQEMQDLVDAKEPFVRLAGRWHALRKSDVERALRFLERRRQSAGLVELMRAVSGLETDEASISARSRSTPTSTASSATARDGSARSGRPRGCSSGSSRSRSAATAGCACSATWGSARSSPTTWASGRPCRRSRC
jgi:hypothetical protein